MSEVSNFLVANALHPKKNHHIYWNLQKVASLNLAKFVILTGSTKFKKKSIVLFFPFVGGHVFGGHVLAQGLCEPI